MTSLITERPTAWERSREQRFEALQKANRIRSDRSRVKHQLGTGELRIADVLEDPPECVQSAKVLHILLAVRGIGEAKARRILLFARVSDAKTVGGLSGRQRAVLVEDLR